MACTRVRIYNDAAFVAMRLNAQDFGQYLFVVRKSRPSTVKINLQGLKIISKSIGKKALTTELFEAFIQERLDSYSDVSDQNKAHNSLNTKITAYNNYVAYLTYRGIPHKLTKFTHFKKNESDITPLSRGEMKALLNVKLTHELRGRNFHKSTDLLEHTYRTFTWLLLLTGGRFNESASIQVKDVNLFDGEVRFTETKSGRPRTAHIFEPLLGMLKTLTAGKKSTDLVFQNLFGNKLDRQVYAYDLERRAKAAGITIKVHPHLLRHSFSVDLRKNGVQIEELKELLGHRNIQTTVEFYGHIENEEKRRATQKHSINKEHNSPEDKIVQLEEYLQKEFRNDFRFKPTLVPQLVSIAWKSVSHA